MAKGKGRKSKDDAAKDAEVARIHDGIVKGFLTIGDVSNPRALAIISAALVDRCLEKLLRSKFRDEDLDIFDCNAPLGSYSAKVRLGYAMGLFEKETKADLDRIGKVRNVFAHSIEDDLGFDDPAIRKECEALTVLSAADQPDHVLRYRRACEMLAVEFWAPAHRQPGEPLRTSRWSRLEMGSSACTSAA